MTLPTIIAELEEAERALSRALGLINTKASIVSVAPRPLEEDLNGLMLGVRSALSEFETISTHLPTLLEALKRQGEALSHIVSIGEAHGSNYDFERILDMRDIARAARSWRAAP